MFQAYKVSFRKVNYVREKLFVMLVTRLALLYTMVQSMQEWKR